MGRRHAGSGLIHRPGRDAIVGPASSSPPPDPEIDNIFGSLLHSWFRAESAADFTIETGDVVSAWINRTGGGNAVQATGALQPAFAATGFNGVPCVTGGGTQWLQATLSTPLAQGSRPYFLCVGRQNVIGANDFWYGTSDAATSSNGHRVSSAGVIQARGLVAVGGSGTVESIDGGSTSAGARHLVEYGLRNSTTAKAFVDGSPFNGAQTAGLHVANDRLGILASGTGGTIAEASIAELIILNAIPTDEQLTAARAVLGGAGRGYGLTLA